MIDKMLSTGKTVAVYLGLALVFAFAILSGSSIDCVLGKKFNLQILRSLDQVLGVPV